MTESTAVPVESFTDRNRDLAAAFERYCIARGLSPKTRRSYRDTLGRLLNMLESRSVLSVCRADIRELQTRLLERGLSPNSLLIHTAAIRGFYKFLRIAGLVRIDPCARLDVRRVPRRLPRVLTVEEVERLIAACKTPFERAVVEVLYATAVRVSELVKIRLEDVTFNSGLDSGTIRVNKGKGGKDRLVLFGSHAGAAMIAYAGERSDGFLFEHHGKAYTAGRIYILLNVIAKRAGVSGVHPHAFRRAAATHMLQHGADLRAVQELLGHECLSTTQLYTNLQCADLQRVHDRCHPHARGGEDEKAR